jgi:hypothetical protein
MKKKFEDSDGNRIEKRRAVNIKENLSKKICLKKQKEKRKCRRKIESDESEFEESAGIDETELCDDAELGDTDSLHRHECLVCGEFGRDGELRYRCVSCSYWSHSECSGWNTNELHL